MRYFWTITAQNPIANTHPAVKVMTIADVSCVGILLDQLAHLACRGVGLRGSVVLIRAFDLDVVVAKREVADDGLVLPHECHCSRSV